MAGQDTRERLRAELRRREGELAQMEAEHARMIEASEASNADDEHDPEGSTIAFEREQLVSLTTRVRQTIEGLHQALADLEAGDYGRCERCGTPIDPERLEVRPQTRLCIACARLAPRG